MKKFLIFLVSIVVVVCVGLTTFYFMKNDEIIVIETKEIYVNAGDTITLEELGFSRQKASKKTTFNYNAGGEDVKSAVCFDDSKGYYVVNGSVAGDVNLVITTSNKKYGEFTVTVHIGNGAKETPYYVFNETDLTKIGADYALNASFKLMNNITLSPNFAPIGFSQLDNKYVGFSGNFDGNGKTISSLDLKDSTYSNAGLFSSINSGAVVSNLTIANSSISGAYANAGILAGEIAGSVNRIAILSSKVLSSSNNANIGALAGGISGSAQLTYANNVVVTAGSESAVKDVNVGGLFGKINQATVKACYVNNANISTDASSTGKFGGFAGEFVVNDSVGSIQQSYANVNSDYINLGAFLGGISANSTVKAEDSIRFLIGNAVVLNGKNVVTAGNYNSAIFTNFVDTAKSTYLINSFATQGEMQIFAETNGLVFYAINSTDVVYWDTEYIWQTSNSGLPTLRLTKLDPSSPSGEYFRKDLTENEINETTSTFDSVFSGDVENTKFLLLNDVTISNHTPANLKNVTFDGNNKTITLALNNKNGENLGLFGKLDNCTIKNLNIVITGVTANATNVGAVAGTVLSSDSVSSSSLENINITFQNCGDITATNFGGVVAVAEKTNIKNVSVTGLNVASNIFNVGGAVAELKSDATIDGVKVNATLSGTKNVGGVVANNFGSITNVNNSNVIINYNSTESDAHLGGISAENTGKILKSEIIVEINIISASSSIYAGGASAINNGEIANVTIYGNGISVDETNAKVYVGGVVATNNSNIELATAEMASVGANFAGKNIWAGGIACVNNGNISKTITRTSVYGNYAGGAFVEMSKSSAKADQIVVSNTVKGDKYVAGVIVVLKAGAVTNVQASSTITGNSNNARCSLITLIFPYGAKFKNAIIDSSFDGYGIRYREAWIDFSDYANKDEFDLPSSSGVDYRFNLYDNDTYHGSMQSVVLNTANNGVSDAKAPMANAFAWSKDYTDSSESCFIKYVSGFYGSDIFTGSFEFVCAKSPLGIQHKVTKTLTFFETAGVWVNNGSRIALAFTV